MTLPHSHDTNTPRSGTREVVEERLQEDVEVAETRIILLANHTSDCPARLGLPASTFLPGIVLGGSEGVGALLLLGDQQKVGLLPKCLAAYFIKLRVHGYSMLVGQQVLDHRCIYK